MPKSPDRQPLVPPALKRLQSTLKYNESKPSKSSLRFGWPIIQRGRSPASVSKAMNCSLNHAVEPFLQDSELDDPEISNADVTETDLSMDYRILPDTSLTSISAVVSPSDYCTETQPRIWDNDTQRVENAVDEFENEECSFYADDSEPMTWSTASPKRAPTISDTRAQPELPQERQKRPNLQGLLSQFYHLNTRRPVMHRVTFAITSLFGRMCARRQTSTSDKRQSPDDTDTETEATKPTSHNSSAEVKTKESAEREKQGHSVIANDENRAQSTVSSSNVSIDPPNDLLEKTRGLRDILPEAGMTQEQSNLLRLNEGTMILHEAYSGEDSDDESIVEVGEYGRDHEGFCAESKKRGDGIDQQSEESVQSPCFKPGRQQKSRWTFLSPMSLLRAVKSRASHLLLPGADPQSFSAQERTIRGRLEFMDLTDEEQAWTESRGRSYEDEPTLASATQPIHGINTSTPVKCSLVFAQVTDDEKPKIFELEDKKPLGEETDCSPRPATHTLLHSLKVQTNVNFSNLDLESWQRDELSTPLEDLGGDKGRLGAKMATIIPSNYNESGVAFKYRGNQDFKQRPVRDDLSRTLGIHKLCERPDSRCHSDTGGQGDYSSKANGPTAPSVRHCAYSSFFNNSSNGEGAILLNVDHTAGRADAEYKVKSNTARVLDYAVGLQDTQAGLGQNTGSNQTPSHTTRSCSIGQAANKRLSL